MRLWDTIKRSLGDQVRTLNTAWKTAGSAAPSYDHIPESEVGFFESQYLDFLERAAAGEALIANYERDEPSMKGSHNGASSLMINDAPHLLRGNTHISIQPNKEFLGRFQTFLRGFDFSPEQINQALTHAQNLSCKGIEENRAQHAQTRSRYAARHDEYTP